jgi:hypothetical protein
MNKNELNSNDNIPEKNYYWQSFVISFALSMLFIIVFSALGIYSEEITGVGSIFFLLLSNVVNVLLKKFVKKHGDDLLK